METVSNEVLNAMSENTAGGGGTDKLSDRRIADKLAKLYGAHEKPTTVDDSVEKMKARNVAIRLTKHIPLREQKPK